MYALRDNDVDSPVPVTDPVLATQLSALRQDFRDFRDEMRENTKDLRAILRVVADPESGYVPRSEIDYRFAAVYNNARWAIGLSVALASVMSSAATMLIARAFH